MQVLTVLTVSAILLLQLVGCAYSQPAGEQINTSPEAAVRREAEAGFGLKFAQDLQIVEVRQTQYGVVALWRSTDQSLQKEQSIVGMYLIEERKRSEWHVIERGYMRVDDQETELVEYVQGSSVINGVSQAGVLGLGLSSDVTLVEARFNDGQVISETVKRDLFLLMAWGASAVCEINIYNGNQLLRQIDLTSVQSTPTPGIDVRELERRASTATEVDRQLCPNN